MGKFTHLMIHCSATPATFDVRPKHITQWHIKERGWSRVGYSMLIRRSGRLHILIPFDRDDIIESWEISNGAIGWNGRTKHICWVGGTTKNPMEADDNRTVGQQHMLEAVVEILIMLYPDIKLIGHNQVSKKFCPSFDVPEWCKSIGVSSKNIDFHKYA